MRKILRIALVILLAFVIAVPVGAVDNVGAEQSVAAPDGVVRPMYIAIGVLTAGLTINGWGLATCSGTVCPNNNTYTSYLTVGLLRSNGDGTWTQVTSWSGSGVGISGVTLAGQYYVTHGTYRVCSAAFIYSSGGVYLDSALCYSATVVY
jgi:hypothetical protein